MGKVTYKITRFDLMNNPPTHRIVGFTLKNEFGDTCYCESTIPLTDIKELSDIDTCMLAYKNIKTEIKIQEQKLKEKSVIIGYEFIPPEDDIAEDVKEEN